MSVCSALLLRVRSQHPGSYWTTPTSKKADRVLFHKNVYAFPTCPCAPTTCVQNISIHGFSRKSTYMYSPCCTLLANVLVPLAWFFPSVLLIFPSQALDARWRLQRLGTLSTSPRGIVSPSTPSLRHPPRYFMYDGRKHVCAEGSNIINIFSFSKAYGMMGWRVGYVSTASLA